MGPLLLELGMAPEAASRQPGCQAARQPGGRAASCTARRVKDLPRFLVMAVVCTCISKTPEPAVKSAQLVPSSGAAIL